MRITKTAMPTPWSALAPVARVSLDVLIVPEKVVGGAVVVAEAMGTEVTTGTVDVGPSVLYLSWVALIELLTMPLKR